MKILLIRPGTPLLYQDSALVLTTLAKRTGIEFSQVVLPGNDPIQERDEWSPCYSPHTGIGHISLEAAAAGLRNREFDLVVRVPFDNRRYTRKARLGRLAWTALKKCRAAGLAKRWLDPVCNHLPMDVLERNRQMVVDQNDRLFLNEDEQQAILSGALYFKWDHPFDRSKLIRRYGRPCKITLAAMEKSLRYIPLGLSDARYAKFKSFRTENKEWDVFWAGTLGNLHRRRIVREVAGIAKQRGLKALVLEEKVSPEEFCKLAASSKVILSAEGQGWECWRHIEAFALGSIPLMNMPTADAVAWHDMPGELFFENNLHDLEKSLLQLVGDDALRQKLHAQCEPQIESELLWSKMMDRMLNEATRYFPDLPAS